MKKNIIQHLDRIAAKFFTSAFENNRQEFSAKASQEIHEAGVPVISLIHPRELLPQPSGQPTVPIFRISIGNQEIQPAAIPESLIVQGRYDCNLPFTSSSAL